MGMAEAEVLSHALSASVPYPASSVSSPAPFTSAQTLTQPQPPSPSPVPSSAPLQVRSHQYPLHSHHAPPASCQVANKAFIGCTKHAKKSGAAKHAKTSKSGGRVKRAKISKSGVCKDF